MPLKIVFKPHLLKFKKEAGTSRGVMTQRNSWILKVTDSDQPGIEGYGECGPLPGLSIDDIPDFEEQLTSVCETFNEMDLEVFPFNLSIILEQIVPEHLPSARFGMEMALLDFMNGGKRIIYKNEFSAGQKGILMNGLIWMGSCENMLEQVDQKLSLGFSTLKMKVGAIDFEQELTVLRSVRKRFSKDEITLRVDANGAFQPDEVNEKLKRLSEFDLHSIEQPIKAGQHDRMAEICKSSPVPVALDEELIGIFDYREKFALLKKIQPPFIILKPTLLGGFQHTKEWIEIANRLNIGWWVTSALESNIGLNAIAQFTAASNNTLPQGLGTGQLYHNNFESPLTIKNGYLFYDLSESWELPEIV
ncbi:o-succinylbenzoate synthase [Dyadobacter psychrotolerans]|uniref:o-succinylbenzoate synthase n=1 Tax=Dyadobacter psychrotolerans TaxID=2541721 RepID=A0A4R5DZX9_9BACT|nr:o-succinylbenzoate synthase [Dyadobacter psychrotolerans]TDE18140.1 o-succinylbenzoate synthase [Dyadobacter psychrotolerans]